MKALSELKSVERVAQLRGMTVEELPVRRVAAVSPESQNNGHED